jgi:hypothetical protein
MLPSASLHPRRHNNLIKGLSKSHIHKRKQIEQSKSESHSYWTDEEPLQLVEGFGYVSNDAFLVRLRISILRGMASPHSNQLRASWPFAVMHFKVMLPGDLGWHVVLG